MQIFHGAGNEFQPDKQGVWQGPECMQKAYFGIHRMMLLEQKENDQDVYELHFLGFYLKNFKDKNEAKQIAPAFAKEVIKKLARLVDLEVEAPKQEQKAAIYNLKEAVTFFDKVQTSGGDMGAVGTDHFNWLESASKKVAKAFS